MADIDSFSLVAKETIADLARRATAKDITMRADYVRAVIDLLDATHFPDYDEGYDDGLEAGMSDAAQRILEIAEERIGKRKALRKLIEDIARDLR